MLIIFARKLFISLLLQINSGCKLLRKELVISDIFDFIGAHEGHALLGFKCNHPFCLKFENGVDFGSGK